MSERFGPFSECAKQHVAVKPQKGELLSMNTSNVNLACFQRLHYLCASLAADVQCLEFSVRYAVITFASVCTT